GQPVRARGDDPEGAVPLHRRRGARPATSRPSLRRRAPERAALATAFVGRPLQLRGARARRRRVDAPAAAQARMEEHVRMTTRPARDLWLLRAKYAVFGIAIAAGLALLQETHALAVLNDVVNQCFELAARFGAPGMFAAGVLGNASILVQIPY